MTEPIAEQAKLPAAYGKPDRLLSWADVERRLLESAHYWLATTRPDGRPHVVPVDGVWLDGACFFSGDALSVHQKNLRADSRTVIHLEDAEAATIVEGSAVWHEPSENEAIRLASAAKQKYGYGSSPASYRSGVWRLRPDVVLAWQVLYQDATRFRFT